MEFRRRTSCRVDHDEAALSAMPYIPAKSPPGAVELYFGLNPLSPFPKVETWSGNGNWEVRYSQQTNW